MYPYFRKGIALCVNTHKDPQAAHHCENGNTSKHQSTLAPHPKILYTYLYGKGIVYDYTP